MSLIPKEYTIIEDVPATLKNVEDFEFISFIEPSENYINGDIMRERAKEKQANLGIADAQKLLDKQENIPKEMRKFFIVFTGTLLRFPGGYLYVPFLFWRGERWVLDFGWIGNSDWDGFDRLPRCKSLEPRNLGTLPLDTLARLELLETKMAKLEKIIYL